jgi:FkbM family methyltransferase
MSQTEDTAADPMLRYEYAKRAGQVTKRKVNTSYGKFFFWTGTPEDDKEVDQNMTYDYYDGPWMRQIPVEIRKRLVKHNWIDMGSHTGWFAFKLVHKLMPKGVYCTEPSDPRFTFLRHTHMNNDRNGVIALMFKHVVPTKEFGVSVGTVKVDSTTGLASLSGDTEVQVPLIGFDDLVRRHNISALRCNIGGYEKDILLTGDLSRIKVVLAHVNKADYTDKEYRKLKSKLKKAYHNVHTFKTDKKGVVYIIAYNEDMVV